MVPRVQCVRKESVSEPKRTRGIVSSRFVRVLCNLLIEFGMKILGVLNHLKSYKGE